MNLQQFTSDLQLFTIDQIDLFNLTSKELCIFVRDHHLVLENPPNTLDVIEYVEYEKNVSDADYWALLEIQEGLKVAYGNKPGKRKGKPPGSK